MALLAAGPVRFSGCGGRAVLAVAREACEGPARFGNTRAASDGPCGLGEPCAASGQAARGFGWACGLGEPCVASGQARAASDGPSRLAEGSCCRKATHWAVGQEKASAAVRPCLLAEARRKQERVKDAVQVAQGLRCRGICPVMALEGPRKGCGVMIAMMTCPE